MLGLAHMVGKSLACSFVERSPTFLFVVGFLFSRLKGTRMKVMDLV